MHQITNEEKERLEEALAARVCMCVCVCVYIYIYIYIYIHTYVHQITNEEKERLEEALAAYENRLVDAVARRDEALLTLSAVQSE